jgi:biotin carboxylase
MKRIIIIEPHSSGIGLVIEAQKNGLEVVVFTQDTDTLKISKKIRDSGARVIVCNTANLSELIEISKEILPVAGVVPGYEFFVEIAAELASVLSLPGISRETARIVRNKEALNERLLSRGIRVPSSKAFEISDLGRRHRSELSLPPFPFVAKPLNLAGSAFVKLISNEEDLWRYVRDFTSNWPSDSGVKAKPRILAQEFISGQEFSVEGVSDKNGVHIFGVTQKTLLSSNIFIELQHVFPAPISREAQNAIELYIREVCEALQLETGAFHAELRIDKRGPVLIEIGARLGGDCICDLVVSSGAGNIYKAALGSYMGSELAETSKSPSVYQGIRYIIRPDTHSFKSLRKNFKTSPSECVFEELLKPGSPLTLNDSDSARIGFVRACHKDFQKLVQILENADENIEVL